MEEAPKNYELLFWASEIIIPIIIFIGVYYIFKPVFGKKKGKDQDKVKED